MTRTQQHEAKFEQLWAAHIHAFNRWNWFPGSPYAVTHMASTHRKLNAYAHKYGPFQCTTEDGVTFTWSA